MAKTLIAYYSWSGTTKNLAERIHQQLPGSDLLEIKVPKGTFSSDMYQTDSIAKKQRKDGNLPGLTNAMPDFAQYDNILVGGPVWSYYPSTPVLAFLVKLGNFAGKVAPFYTSVGNNGNYEQIFAGENKKLNVVAGNDNGHNLAAWLKQFN